MKTSKFEISGVLLVQPAVFGDARGQFWESFSQQRYNEHGIVGNFVQDNFSTSTKSVLRGLHYQIPPFAQGKLCQVISGKVLDVAVDIRHGSPTFGKYVAQELSEENRYQLWIPPGFAHGFAVLSEFAVFSYKCTHYYNKNSERTLLYSDSAVGVNWGIENPIVSEKDIIGKLLSEIDKDFIF